jgi:hypothetical protein
MTIVQENIHEIPQFIRKRAEFGFEYINFGYDLGIVQWLADNPGIKTELATAVQAAFVEAAVWVEPSGLRRLGLL